MGVMFRRSLNLVLFVGGPVLLGGWLLRYPPDARRAAAVGLTVIVGAALNLTGLLRRHVAVRYWLRLLALLVGAIVVAGVLLMRSSVVEALDAVSMRAGTLKVDLDNARRGLECLVVAMLYVMASVALLPPPRRLAGEVAGEKADL
jgi:hypothetical protein